MNHLGVLLHGETQILVLHGFLVEIDLWDGRVHFAKLHLLLLLLDICIGSWMLRDWLAAAFLCRVFLIVLRLVSVAVLWFVLPAAGYALLLPAVAYALVLPAVGYALVLLAVGYAFLPAVGFALLACCWFCSSLFFSSLLQIFDVLLPFLVPLLLYFILLTTGSLAVVPSVPLLQSHFVVVYD